LSGESDTFARLADVIGSAVNITPDTCEGTIVCNTTAMETSFSSTLFFVLYAMARSLYSDAKHDKTALFTFP
jgi:hypothetical protein